MGRRAGGQGRVRDGHVDGSSAELVLHHGLRRLLVPDAQRPRLWVAVVKEEVDHGKHDARSAALSDNVSERSLQLHRDVLWGIKERPGATQHAQLRRGGLGSGGAISFGKETGGNARRVASERRSRYMGTVKSDMRVRIIELRRCG